jgi:hypothetical protein
MFYRLSTEFFKANLMGAFKMVSFLRFRFAMGYTVSL